VAAPETKKKNRVKKATRSHRGVRKASAPELAHAGASVFDIAARLSRSDVASSAPQVAEAARARLVGSRAAAFRHSRAERSTSYVATAILFDRVSQSAHSARPNILEILTLSSSQFISRI